MSITSPELPEFSRLVDATKIDATFHIEANTQECEALAKRLGILAVKALTADLTLTATSSGDVLVKGTFTGAVEQACVVTLDPVPESHTEEVEALYSKNAVVDESQSIDGLGDVLFGPDLPEPIVNGKIDLGELVVQHLSLSLDPYPRTKGLDFTNYEIG